MRAVLREELNETETRLTSRIAEVESGLGVLKDDFRSLEKRLEAVERRSLTGGTQDGLADSTDQWENSLSKAQDGQSAAKVTRYWRARRSLRLWPVKGDVEDLHIELQRFLSQRLHLGEDVLTNLGNCSIRRIPAPRNNKGDIQHKVTVEFPTVDLRDVVRGPAYNLAGQKEAGIRLEVPHHLMANFKALNAASYRLRMKFKECKRNVKFDDENYDLILDFKTSPDSNWRRLRPKQVRDFLREEGAEAEELSTADLGELFGGPTDEEDE